MTHTRVDSLFLRRISRLSAPFFTGNHPEHSPLFPKPCGDSDSLSLLISTPYFAPRTGRFCVVFGFTLLYLGFGGLLVLTLQIRDVFGGKTATCLRPLGACCAYIGRHSYSIYLWHLPFMLFTPVVLHKVAHLQVPTAALGAFHLLGCCAFGILFAHLIEFPVLKLRDRFFPMFPPAPKPAATPAISTVAADFPAPAKARAAGAA
jgi:peptidoglycan/LPS O-acetylase OafA/YrhL